MKKIILFMCAILLIVSCTKTTEELTEDTNYSYHTSKDKNLHLKKTFSKALAKALLENEDVRALIKNEALKKINHDYDVLYQFIKDVKLNGGTTLRELLLNHISSENLIQIENNIPTLTIFVPELPENTFSAELWDINNDIPMVGIRTC